MMKKEIKPYSEFSTFYKIFTTVFLLCFSLLFTYLIIFQVDDIREIPRSGSVFLWIKYCITAILDIAVLSIFAFANYYVLSANFNEKKKKEIIADSDRTTTKKIFITIICFAVIALKIIFSVMTGIVKAVIEMLQSDPHSVLPWVLLLFFSAIAIAFFLIFRYIIKRFRKANKILETGKMDIFKGVVANKQRNTNTLVKRSGELYSYNITLDTGKEFQNVQRIYFESVEIGQSVEIHTIPEVGEILHFYVI